jgi:hypothetical protein
MASLYTTANNARKIIVIIVAIVVVILIADTFLKWREATAPATSNERRFYLDPDLALGTIPVPEIPKLDVDISGVPIVQESIHSLFPDASYVYKIEQPREKINTLENASKTASTLGFLATGLTNLGNNSFRWAIPDSSKTLNFNKVSQVWEMNTVYENNIDAKRAKTLSNNLQTYNSRATGLVTTLGFRDALGLQDPEVDSRYLVRTERGEALETQKFNEANYIAINLFRKIAQSDLKPQGEQPELLLNEIRPVARTGKVYSDDPRFGQLSFVASNNIANLTQDIFEMDFINYEYSTKGNYLIITPEEAVSRIQKGQGSLVALTAEGENYFSPFTKTKVTRFKVDARKTELAFYEPKKWSGFAYPIYVLNGTADLENGKLARFTFYVDAIKRLDN